MFLVFIGCVEPSSRQEWLRIDEGLRAATLSHFGVLKGIVVVVRVEALLYHVHIGGRRVLAWVQLRLCTPMVQKLLLN